MRAVIIVETTSPETVHAAIRKSIGGALSGGWSYSVELDVEVRGKRMKDEG
jgi:hypothetical protein